MNLSNKLRKLDIVYIFILVGIVPFILFAKNYTLPFYVDSGNIYTGFDYFNYYKVIVIRTLAVIISIDYIATFLTSQSDFFLKDRIKNNFSRIHLFCIFIVLSTIFAYIFSDYKAIVLTGAIERFESIWVHLSYVVIFLYSLSFFKKEGAFLVFSYSVLLSTFVVGLFGTLQFIGVNPFNFGIIKLLTTGSKTTNLNITMPGSFSTMYNTNTSASYSLFMIYTLLMIIFVNKNKIISIIGSINSILLAITLYNSYSEATYIVVLVSIAIAVLLAIIVFYLKGQKKMFITLLSASIITLFISIFAIISNQSLNQKVSMLVDSFIGPEATFTDWEQKGNQFYFYNKDDKYILVEMDGTSYNIFEGDNLLLSETVDNLGVSSLETKDFSTIEIESLISELDSNIYLEFNNYFLISTDDEPMLVTSAYLEPIEHVDFIGFEGYGNMFTNRGFIWSRSLQMVADRAILGYGSDTYFIAFPNNDYAGLAFYNQPSGVHIDKPHNIYLNMAISNGIFYLIGFIGILGTVFYRKVKLFKKIRTNEVNTIALIFYLSGIVAYCLNGLSTDNLVVIIMLFWIYLAIDDSIFLHSNVKNETEELKSE